MSFASARLTLINRNSCSILSNVWFDKSFPNSVTGCDYRRPNLAKQRRSTHNEFMTSGHLSVYGRFGFAAA
jgi:hypothetical protein